MRRKPIFRAVALMISCLIFLAACSAPTHPASATPTAGVEVRTLTFMGAEGVTDWDTRDDQASWKTFQTMLSGAGLGLEVEAIPQNQYATVLKARLASATNLPDLVQVDELDTATKVDLGRSGLFLDVKPLVDQYDNGNIKVLAAKYFRYFWGPVLTPDGKAYWMPGWLMMTLADKPYYNLDIPLIRYDWLQGSVVNEHRSIKMQMANI